MNVVLACALLVNQAQGQIQSQPNWLGLKPAQVVAIGERGWMTKFCEARGGETTVNMVEANDSFGQAMRAVNNSKIGALKSNTATVFYDRLRNQLAESAEKVYLAGFGLSGGGTMWSPINAAIIIRVETTVQHLMSPAKSSPQKSKVEANAILASSLARVMKDEDWLRAAEDGTGVKFVDVKAAMESAIKDCNKVEELLANKSEQRKRIVYAFYHQLGVVIREMTLN